jgi:hypothetical protein
MLHRFVLTAMIGFVAASCAPNTQDGSAPRASRDVITQDEITASSESNALTLIERLRPQWFRMRSGVDNPVVVYVDGSRRGGAEQLRGIPIGNMIRAQFLSGSEATTRFGLNHGSGAILITTTGR